MRAIWKFEVEVTSEPFKIVMPKDSAILSVQVQKGVPCIWCLIDESRIGKEGEARYFKVIGTGHRFDITGLAYIGTFQLVEGSFIGHLFEVVK